MDSGMVGLLWGDGTMNLKSLRLLYRAILLLALILTAIVLYFAVLIPSGPEDTIRPIIDLPWYVIVICAAVGSLLYFIGAFLAYRINIRKKERNQ